MPIKDKSLYPDNWKELSHYIRFDRAKGHCERCGVQHLAVGARDKNGEWHNEIDLEHMNSTQAMALFPGGYPHMTKIILTTAHIDHDTTNNAYSNLLALCQRCHLAHDATQHHRNATKTRRANKAAAIAATGQLTLLDESETT